MAEEELAESLMDLKMAIDEVKASRTLKQVVGTLLCIGNTLNGVKVDAFDLEYLSRCVDVKDTRHKTPLLVHMVELVLEKFPESTNLHSEMSHIHRVAKVGTRSLWSHIITSISTPHMGRLVSENVWQKGFVVKLLSFAESP